MTRYRGFTMLELMAVVAVIGILAVLAMPTYMDAIVRDQVKAALPLADIAKPPIAMSWALAQTVPGRQRGGRIAGGRKDRLQFRELGGGAGRRDPDDVRQQRQRAISGKMLSLRPAVVEDAPIVPIAWVAATPTCPTR